jgi:hypothetical protein
MSACTITEVATSITAFVGFASRGPLDEPMRVHSFTEFERSFGELSALSTMSYAVLHYFLNGGREALIVRSARAAGVDRARWSSFSQGAGADALRLEASSGGFWGDSLRVRIDHDAAPATRATFTLSVKDLTTEEIEVFENLSTDEADTRYAGRVLERGSSLLRAPKVPAHRPAASEAPPASVTEPFIHASSIALIGGSDGARAVTDLVPASRSSGAGIYALEKTDLFNLLCIPPPIRGENLPTDALEAASMYCAERRALLLVDPPSNWAEPADLAGGADPLSAYAGLCRRNSAVYFPEIRMADPVLGGAIDSFPPCGAVAGVIARTDAARGVWKAPAGQEATLSGAAGLSVALSENENDKLNSLGINCLRTFPTIGSVVWGARTMEGADALASEWKYLPVRRLALFLEESLYRGTEWVAFESNDEPLWAKIRLNVNAFLRSLFRMGAFSGTTAREAYFVKCDAETTTENDIDLGLVNILVGFAPLKPAEFVIVRIQQRAGHAG